MKFTVDAFVTWSSTRVSFEVEGQEALEKLIGKLVLDTPPERKTGIKIKTEVGFLGGFVVTPVGEHGEGVI